MQENESLRNFMKRFGQAALQVESYSTDTILQIFKRSISPDTSFFKSLAKKSPTSMDNFFRQADKYTMHKDGVQADFQQVLVTNRPTKYNKVETQSPRIISLDKGDESRTDDSSNPSSSPHWPSLMSNSFHWFKRCLISDGQSRSRLIGINNALTIRSMDIPQGSARIYTTW